MLSTTEGLPHEMEKPLVRTGTGSVRGSCFERTFSSCPSSFYQGKTITVIVSSDAGGTVDMRVKALAPVLRKYIEQSNHCHRVHAGRRRARPPATSTGRSGPTV